jgi:hypothetical protein
MEVTTGKPIREERLKGRLNPGSAGHAGTTADLELTFNKTTQWGPIRADRPVRRVDQCRAQRTLDHRSSLIVVDTSRLAGARLGKQTLAAIQ